MQFTASAGNLLPCLHLALATTESREPIQSLLRISASKGAVDLYTTTGTAGTCATVADAKVKAAGVSLVDAGKFAQSVRECDGDIQFSIKNNNLKMIAGNNEFQLIAAEDSKSFPFKEQVEFGIFSTPLPPFREAIRLCLPAAGTIRQEETRGAMLEPVKKGMRVSAISGKASAGASSLLDCKMDSKELIVTSIEFCKHILALGSGDEEIAVGVDGGTIAVSHRFGYSYFPLLHGKPAPSEAIISKLNLDAKPVMASAGLFAKSVKNVLVMSDKEEAYKGRLLGIKGGVEIYSHTNTAGAARSKLITAGDLTIDSWYNFRSLLDYLSKVGPEEELKLHTVAGKYATALVIQHGNALYYLSGCEPPHDDKK